jgi:hypothetical protein
VSRPLGDDPRGLLDRRIPMVHRRRSQLQGQIDPHAQCCRDVRGFLNPS